MHHHLQSELSQVISPRVPTTLFGIWNTGLKSIVNNSTSPIFFSDWDDNNNYIGNQNLVPVATLQPGGKYSAGGLGWPIIPWRYDKTPPYGGLPYNGIWMTSVNVEYQQGIPRDCIIGCIWQDYNTAIVYHSFGDTLPEAGYPQDPPPVAVYDRPCSGIEISISGVAPNLTVTGTGLGSQGPLGGFPGPPASTW